MNSQQAQTKYSLIQPLTIGKLNLQSNLVQGPLAGFSCAPFRKLIWQHSEPGFCCTEMLSAIDLITRKPQRKRYVWKSPDEGLLCFQLAGRDPHVMAQATQEAEQYGADIIDVNCGCPKNKIRRKGYGSKLLNTPELLADIIKHMRAATTLPLSIKIRVSGNYKDMDHLHIAQLAQDNGCDFITVHGRHWQDDYSVDCHMDQVADIAHRLTIPVLFNGDANSADKCRQILKDTQCKGIMISRATMGQPWLFSKINAHMNEQQFTLPSKQQIGKLLLQHVTELAQLDNERSASLQARQFSKYYLRSAGVDLQQLTTFQHINSLSELEILITKTFY